MVKHEVYRGLMPRPPYDTEEEEEQSTSGADQPPRTRWTLLLADVTLVLFSLFLMYAILVISISYTATDVRAVTSK